MVARKCGLGAIGLFGLVARVGERGLQELAFGDVATNALDFDQTPVARTDGVVFPRDPAIARHSPDLLIIGNALGPGLAAREAAECDRRRIGVVFRAKHLSDDVFGAHPEQLQEGLIGIGDPAVRRAAQDHIALGVEKALVARFAVLKPCVRRLKLPRELGQLLGAAQKVLGAAAQRNDPEQQKGKARDRDASQEPRIEHHQAAVQIEVGRRGAPKRQGQRSKEVDTGASDHRSDSGPELPAAP